MNTQEFLKSAEAVVSQGSQAEVVVPETPVTEIQASAEIAVDPPVDTPENPPVTQETPVVTEPPVLNEPVDYWAELATKTEGLVKDEETFKGIVEKSKSYDTLAQEKADLEKNQFKPANDYVAKFNELILSGANTDQIKAFVKLNDYGNLDELKPLEAQVAKLVLIDGYSEDVARKKVNREFNTSQYDEEIPEEKEAADILREELTITGRKALEVLKDYRKDLSVVHNPEKEQAEQAKLQEIAKVSTYNKTVEQEAPKIAKNFPAKFTHEFKIGDETIPYEETIDQDFLDKALPAMVADYFRDTLDEITPESVKGAYSAAYGDYLKANHAKELERVATKFYNEGVEKTVNKYENRSGLPRAEENQVVLTNNEGLDNFMKRLVNK